MIQMLAPLLKKKPVKSLVIISVLVVVWIFIALGCKDVHVPSGIYWTNGCVSADESLLGIGGQETLLVDLKNGEIKKRLEDFPGGAICLPNGDVVSLTGTKAKWLTADKQIDGKFDFGLIGTLDNERLVGSSRSAEEKDGVEHFLEPLQLVITNLNAANSHEKQLSLDSRLFPGVVGFEFRTNVIRLLPNKQVLAAAGEKPPTGLLAHPRSPWGFFTVDLEKGNVAAFGETRTSDDDINLAESKSSFTATPDGKIIAGAFGFHGTTNPKTLAVFDSGKEVFRSKVEKADYVGAICLNSSGSLLAVGVSENGFEIGRMDVLDAHTGKLLWSARTTSPTTLLEFLKDDSLVFMTKQRGLSVRNGKTGTVMWEIKEQD